MINLQQDGVSLAKIELVDGKLKIAYTDKAAADDIIENARFINDRRLTDEEMYHTMPARYHGRIFAAATHKVDRSIFPRIMKEVHEEYMSRPGYREAVERERALEEKNLKPGKTEKETR